MKKNLFRITLLLSFAAFLFSGCKKDDDNDSASAPQIPPVSTMAMDFSAFSDPSDTLGSRQLSSYHNWGYSYLTVLSWHTVVSVGLAIPVAAFKESFNHEAIYNPANNNWTWTYNVSANNSIYTAKLIGEIQADSVFWQMKISQGNFYTDFLWFYGKSALNESGGYWMLMENPGSPSNLLRIDWHRSDEQVGDIKYTNIRTSDPQFGAFIAYGMTTGTFDRFYAINNAVEANLTSIEWHSVQHIGRVKDAVHFGNSDWHCWDANLMDTLCD